MEPVASKRKLIEVALPLDDINAACVREKSIRHGHPSALHLWWARRPLAAARAVIFAQMVDDPSAHPELFPTEADQERERERLFEIIRQLVQWENTTNESVLASARAEIWKTWRMTCAENANHPRARELFDPEMLPGFHDPFAGGGALPLEAQRLGLEAFASDLNPVAVLINKAMIDIPSRFSGRAPINPPSLDDTELLRRSWHGVQGLADDVQYYGRWMRAEAEKRIAHLYPKIEITQEMAERRPDLAPIIGRQLTVIAWLWARTVKSPNPAFADIDVPLASTFILSTKPGREAYVDVIVAKDSFAFDVRAGKPKDPKAARNGTKTNDYGANFSCVMSGAPIPADYIKAQAQANSMGARLMAIVAEGDGGRVYLSPTLEHEQISRECRAAWRPDVEFFQKALGFRVGNYGMTKWSDLFSERQLVALTTFSDLIATTREKILADAIAAGMLNNGGSLADGGVCAPAYADAVAVYLGFLVNQIANHSSSVCGWNSANAQMRSVFARQALPMVWDFAESNIFCNSSGSFNNLFERQIKGFAVLGTGVSGTAKQMDACGQNSLTGMVISTDPPYYDNIGYADLSDFFYVWLRHSQRSSFPEIFETVTVPKIQELVATPARHGGKEKAEAFFLDGMTKAMHCISAQSHPAFPATIYYAFKQSATDSDKGTVSTGWETFLDAVIRAGFSVSGTWPIRTEKEGRVRGNDSNALASSIILTCRPRPANPPVATRREFINCLKLELPNSVAHLQRGNVAPVDLAQAAIGPGMAVFTRFARVMDADGKPLTVRNALALINDILDEVLAEQEGDFDPESRFAIAWFEQFGFNDGPFGSADVLARAKNTSVDGLAKAYVVASGGGQVRLIRPAELNPDWHPMMRTRVTVWETVHQLIRALESDGEVYAGTLVAELASKAEVARELAYRLYTIAERRKWMSEALQYNGLVQSWPEILRLSRDVGRDLPVQGELLGTL